VDLALQDVEGFVPVMAVRRRAGAFVTLLQRDAVAPCAAFEASTVTCVPTTFSADACWSGRRTK
jgi:hypothetical protein